MRPFVIFLLICIVFSVWFVHFFKNGKLQAYLDAHPNPSWGVRLQYYIGVFHYYRKNRKEAIVCANRVMEVYPKSQFIERALFLRARALHELRMKKEAMKDYKNYYTTYPDGKNAKLAEKRYRRLAGFE